MQNDKLRGVSPAAMAAFVKNDMANFVTAMTPGGIESQEAAGQVMFVNSATLPKEG